jgi:prepilin-type N-terminal cleavage/methylation domain-containing protein
VAFKYFKRLIKSVGLPRAEQTALSKQTHHFAEEKNSSITFYERLPVMSRSIRRSAFTLVEVLIVVVIMAVLAATIIPQFSDSAKDAKISTTKFNLHTLRAQIQLYRTNHDGDAPDASLVKLTQKTDVAGTVGTTAAHIYGPYLSDLPVNSLTGGKVVGAPNAVPPTATTADVDWLYDATTGQIWINHADYLSD